MVSKKNEEELIEEALKVNLEYVKGQIYYGNKFHYDYICNIHGIIKMTPQVISKGKGCRKCAYKSTEKTVEQLVRESKLVNMEFVGPYYGTHTKTLYNCPMHGHFNMRPHEIKEGQKCPDCALKGFKQRKKAYFYVLYCEDTKSTEDFIGFGVTNNLKIRLKGHKSKLKINGFKIKHQFEIELPDGMSALWLEGVAKEIMSNVIINTGITGFKREAFPVKYLKEFEICILFAVQLLRDSGVEIEKFNEDYIGD